MHAKTDSEVTSLAASSPGRSSPPRRPVYYVQSPSHDGFEKTTTTSTPVVLSPMGSPPHSHSSVGHHSRESSSSRFSGSLKPAGGSRSKNERGKGGQKPWNNNKGDCDVIEEEGLLDEEDNHHKSLPRRCYVLAFVVGFFLLFSFFSLILYGASRPQKPVITMKSIKFEHLVIQAGSDSTGVATDMVSMNSSVKLLFRNTATFFGVHVTSSPLELSFSDLPLATGSMKRFYQSRKSQRTLTVVVQGNKIPLYGGGATLSSSTGTTTLPMPMKLNFNIRSRAYVLGRIVKPKFYKSVNCSVVFDPKKLNVAIPLNNCTYTTS